MVSSFQGLSSVCVCVIWWWWWWRRLCNYNMFDLIVNPILPARRHRSSERDDRVPMPVVVFVSGPEQKPCHHHPSPSRQRSEVSDRGPGYLPLSPTAAEDNGLAAEGTDLQCPERGFLFSFLAFFPYLILWVGDKNAFQTHHFRQGLHKKNTWVFRCIAITVLDYSLLYPYGSKREDLATPQLPQLQIRLCACDPQHSDSH